MIFYQTIAELTQINVVLSADPRPVQLGNTFPVVSLLLMKLLIQNAFNAALVASMPLVAVITITHLLVVPRAAPVSPAVHSRKQIALEPPIQSVSLAALALEVNTGHQHAPSHQTHSVLAAQWTQPQWRDQTVEKTAPAT